MKKRKLIDWMADYLRLNGVITLEAVNVLYGPTTYGGFTGRISELRSRGMEIQTTLIGYKLLTGLSVVEQPAAPVEPYEARRVNDLQMEVRGIKQEVATLEKRLSPLLSLLKGPTGSPRLE